MPDTGRRSLPLPALALRPSLAAIGLVCLVLMAGCARTGQPMQGSGLRSAPLDDAFVVPPPGGPAMVDILETRYPNATEQKVLLGGNANTSGQNYLQVRFFGPVGQSGTGRTPLKDRPLATTNMAGELRTEFPGIRMGKAPVYVQNRYGAFGYALGRAAGDTCLYAWQRIAATSTDTLLLRSRGVIQLRLRLCQAGATADQLLSVMYGFTIAAYFSDINWNPYGKTPPPGASLGELGTAIYPSTDGKPEAVWGDSVEVAAPPPVTTVRPRRATAAAVRPALVPVAVAAPQPLPAAIGPEVPPPPGLAPTASASPAAMLPGTISANAVPAPPCAGSATSAGTC